MQNLLMSVLLLIAVAGCSTVQVQSDVDPQIDLSKYATYGWLTTKDARVDNIRVENALVVESVRESIEKNLDKKGYVKVGKDQADFLVAWLGAVDKKIHVDEIEHFYNPYGYGALFQNSTSESSNTGPKPFEYDEGTLIVHFVDPVNKEIFWKGSAKERVQEGMSDKDVKLYIEQSVSQVLKLYPSIVK